jgi:hypothetical protein
VSQRIVRPQRCSQLHNCRAIHTLRIHLCANACTHCEPVAMHVSLAHNKWECICSWVRNAPHTHKRAQ